MAPSGAAAPSSCLRRCRSSAQGLTTAEAERRLREHGANALDEEPAAGVGRLALRQFKSPLVLILVFGAAGLGDAARMAGRGHHPGHRAGQLRPGLRAGVARVQRGGAAAPAPGADRQGPARRRSCRRSRRGSWCRATSCSCRPATWFRPTAWCCEARDFLVSEASLTGESFPVEKQPGVLSADTPIARRTNAVFLGTSVRSGTATRAGRAHRRTHRLRRHRRAAARRRAGDRVRARRAAVRRAAGARDGA